jgi:cytochrome c oxidase subunit 2
MYIGRSVICLACFAAGVAAAAAAAAYSPSPSQTNEPRVIEVVAKRFAFEPSTIEAAVGERLRLVVRSGDGVHGIEIKKFKVSKLIPRRGGRPMVIDFTASEAGTFPIVCQEFCGEGHEEMKGALLVTAAAGASVLTTPDWRADMINWRIPRWRHQQ